MKAIELMVNDWVYDEKDKDHTPFQIKRIYKNTVMDSSGRYHQLVNIRPIDLTPEIMEKNGWKYAPLVNSYNRKGMRLEGDYQDLNELPKGVGNALSMAQWSIDEKFNYHLLDLFMWKGNITLFINYVNELQHAMRLCRIEREIEV